MASLTAAEVKLIEPVVKAQAVKVAARYEGVEPDDLAQEVWLSLLTDAGPAMYDYIQRGELGRATKAIYNAAVKWCEHDKKRRMREQGMNWRDQYNYNRPEVARLLPLALDPGAVPGLSGDGLHDAPSAKSDPAYGGGMLASLADIRVAFAALSESDQQFLIICVSLNSEWDRIGPLTGQQANSAYAKYMRVLDKMVKRLGRVADDDE